MKITPEVSGLRVGTLVPAHASKSVSIEGIAVHDGAVVAVGGAEYCDFLWSTDGVSFHVGSSPSRGLRGACLRDDGLWVVGNDGYLARSLDGGLSWQTLGTKTESRLFDVITAEDGRLWVRGDHGLSVSADGVTFRRVRGADERNLGHITSTSLGVLVPTRWPGHLYLCQDKAVRRLNLVADEDLTSATLTPAGTLITVGSHGAVYRSADRGETFERVDVPGSGRLNAVECLGDLVVIVGENGLILVSADDGRSFVVVEQFVENGTFWCATRYEDSILIGGDNRLIAWLGTAAPVPRATPATIAAMTGKPEPTASVAARPASHIHPAWAAPEESTAVQQWRPPPPMPLERRDGVFVSPVLRAMLHPRRGGIATVIRPLPSVDEAWAALRRALWAADQSGMVVRSRGSGIWSRVTSMDRDIRTVGERISSVDARPGTVVEDSALVSLCMAEYHTFVEAHRGEVHERLADFLVATSGLPGAVRRCMTGLEELPYLGVGPFGRLRELLVLASDDEYAATRREVCDTLAQEMERTPEKRDRVADLHWAATFLLPLGPDAGEIECELHEQALKNVGAFGNSSVHASGLAAGDLATLDRFRKANRTVGHEFFGRSSDDRVYLASLLDIAGGKAVEALSAMRPSWPFHDSMVQNTIWCTLLAHIDDDRALEALHRQRHADVDGRVWGTAGLLLSASFDAERVRRFAHTRNDAELEALVDRSPAPQPALVNRSGDDVFGGRDKPLPYQPMPAIRVVPLRSSVFIEPEETWRADERAEAERVYQWAEGLTWDNVPLSECDGQAIEQFIARKEKWAIPATAEEVALAPATIRDRLIALGFVIGAHHAQHFLAGALSRGGVSCLPVLLAALDGETVEFGLKAAQPFGDVSLVPAVARAFAGKKHKALARSWLIRHPRHAVAGALTLWLDDHADTYAMRVLRYLDTLGHRPTIMRFAAELGRSADVTALLDADPLAEPRVKRPTLPDFVTALALPTLVPVEADTPPVDVTELLTQLAYCNADEVHPGVIAAKQRHTPESLAAFAWALFEAWLAAGASAASSWCMQAVGFFGDDSCARRLTTLARRWPGENASARAQSALDVLLNIGTDTAMININLLAEKSRFPAFAAAARERIQAIADARGLTADELADRLVPTLGLDENDGDIIDTGAHKYRIVFDEQLAPMLREGAGPMLRDLPRPGKLDDKALAKAAKAQLMALRKDAKASASLHLSRIERAMCDGRTIDAAVFLDRYANHPWMTHLARRLVWGTVDNGELVSTFRVAEDGSLANRDDDRLELTGDASVVVAHPLDMSTQDLASWLEVFADYSILQPFPQLDRPVYRPTGQIDLSDVVGRCVDHGQMRGLESRGWQRWYDVVMQMAKQVHKGVWVILDSEPGWHPSNYVGDIEPQEIKGLSLSGELSDLTQLPPRVYSELVYDLHWLVGSS